MLAIQSWGTKGSDKVDMDLGAAGGGKNAKAGEVDVAVPTEEKDINALYAAELQRLAQPAPPEVKTKSAAQKQEDYYKVGLQLFSEGALANSGTDFPNKYPSDLGCLECWLGSWYFVSISQLLIKGWTADLPYAEQKCHNQSQEQNAFGGLHGLYPLVSTLLMITSHR